MDSQTKKILVITLGALIAGVVVIAVLYARQQLFTRTEPIILSD